MKAILALEDGTIFHGESFGAQGEVIGEIVFNTGMTGYQEVLTDPSYCGQIVAMTYPLIGNYGVNSEDIESEKPQVKGFIVRELCQNPSNWRAEETLNNYLKRNNIIGIEKIDTRALTRILREKGTMKGMISTDPNFNLDDKIDEIKAYVIKDPVMCVTTKEVLHYKGDGFKVALIDLGLKKNIVRSLLKRGCDVHVFPANSKAEDILAINPDGIMLSNGPGDPKDCVETIETIKKLMGKKPMFGICLGHQLTALANGADTEKLKYGHRGANHPVKDLEKDLTYITSQNHGYTIVESSMDKSRMTVSHRNMNDGTVEGVRYKDMPVFTVQFHPEASPGPEDTAYLFDEFIDMMKKYSR
ncbi:MAG TPA: carbamoyl phosphate synthase small subunit [Hungateiclostridium thermocellum]|jgi:carbamoyl-phosphate synthase small subunit|uniref:Carbamoyl phosphate synthase small chain n=2 Tax=Acetivibrio thermocellus TaxID=1515 RepID=A3DE05_ACET2|nr:carbamoyl phosphate synthase small subunit [Acetivibrio thermocellus]CDG35643.1 Carbamoyl-phosphate synthase small chain [Acetivibrio thermocellus BC1]ABN52184.1 carbamoyl-phosphate synthase, small subunit [Acetivibrio thermocellus ATCC 27405]ADU74330.1 carbamoyl-phosphate synthase, small subunit [Acetivibrio thermocellus DSM 1313]ALX08274.1 Carbamoyl-phosphate synthase small chain [Acetivibrio thermocellus AD2]ANV76022.1 Carbamoyl-phosphate synthase small chain [Acetivibrio thermocellus DS